MSKTAFARNIWIAVTLYAIMTLSGFIIYKFTDLFEIFRAVAPFLAVGPATWVAFCIQRRNSYLDSLRSVWQRLVPAVQGAVYYTRMKEPKEDKYLTVLFNLSCVIDELRGVCRNHKEGKENPSRSRGRNIGYYPYEFLKDVYDAVEALGCENYVAEHAERMRREILSSWKIGRESILAEFNRVEPDSVDAF